MVVMDDRNFIHGTGLFPGGLAYIYINMYNRSGGSHQLVEKQTLTQRLSTVYLSHQQISIILKELS